jgi:perosamine synthetase
MHILRNSEIFNMILLSGPNIAGNEWKYVKECLDTAWVSSVGSYVTQFENMMAEFTGTKYAVATSSGTTALHISLLLAGVKQDDYVIVPNLTFIASLNSIKYTGAQPILMDVEEGSWQMNLDILEDFLKNETSGENDVCVFKKDGRIIRAIMPVHVLGNMIDMNRFTKLAAKYKLVVVEDATEALGSYYDGKHSGSFGLLGCFSYNGNKIITTGGGGMIVTNDEQLAKKAKHLTTQAKADAFEYYHDEIGYNYRLVNVLAAMGVAQMEQLPGFIARKKEIDTFYKKEFSGIGDIQFQQVSESINPNCWLFTFRTTKQKELLKVLNDNKMQSRPFWVPMNQLPMFKDDLYISNNDVCGKIYSECLSIPCSTYITDEELVSIANLIKSCY